MCRNKSNGNNVVIGYNIKCVGLKEPVAVRGDSYEDCLRKFKEYWECDYDVDTSVLLEVKSIEQDFDIM